MADLSSPKSMLSRAQRQIDDLDAKINSFMQDKPWSHVVEEDVNAVPPGPRSRGFTHVHSVRFTDRLSVDLPHIVFEAANNLRAVLDQLGFAVANLAGKTNPKSCKFPIGPTETDMRNNAKGGCKDLPPEIGSLFEGFKAYKGGNNALWALNELANTPKHKLLIPVVIGVGKTNFVHVIGSGSYAGLNPRWNSSKNEIAFLLTNSETKVNYNVEIAFSVALDDINEIIRGQHPVSVLRTMASEVQEVVTLTEAMCKQIGIL